MAVDQSQLFNIRFVLGGAAFIIGSIIGSFLNVCIYRLPRNESLLWPPSHCPHCQTLIRWYHNVPLLSWLLLRGRCRYCKKPISPRYLLVEICTAMIFLLLWIRFGISSIQLFFIYALFASFLIVASFIDLEHYIIPDQLTIGLTIIGLAVSLLIPELHNVGSVTRSFWEAILGMVTGAGSLLLVSWFGRQLFGRRTIVANPPIEAELSAQRLKLGKEEALLDELLHRPSDVLRMEATKVQLPDRCHLRAEVVCSKQGVIINGEALDWEKIGSISMECHQLTLPQEVMGLGDVKFLAAIGTFIGWKGVLFTIAASAFIGTTVSLVLIVAGRRQWSQLVPYGPYLALGAAIWIFAGPKLLSMWFALLRP